MEKKESFIRVYCPELMDMISPGEWADCPYYRGQKLDVTNAEEALKLVFRCHVQCDCKIQYQYYEDGKLVQKVEESVEDQESLRRILALVMKPAETAGKKKILIVDDDPDFLEMHSAVLKNKGYEVVTARSSEECLRALETGRPDLVVLDVMMERFDAGFELCKKIKKNYIGLPVMLLTSIGRQTGLEFSSSAAVLRETGADILLDKPVSPETFITEIENLTTPKDKR
jgi:CheY-like chemotaxis protein